MSLFLIVAYALASLVTGVTLAAVILAASLGLTAVVVFPFFCAGKVISAIAARVATVQAVLSFIVKHSDVFFVAFIVLLLTCSGFGLVAENGFPPGISADSQLLPPLYPPEPETAPAPACP